MATLAQIAAAMAAVESGNSPTSLSVIDNNPLNLVYAGQAGATPGAGGFAVFPTYAAGLQAGLNQINLDLTRGTDVNGNPTTTLAQLLSSWSPANAPGNTAASTANYITRVASATGVDPNADLVSQLSDYGTLDAGLLTGAGVTDTSGGSASSISSISSDTGDISAGVADLGISTDTVLLIGLVAVAAIFFLRD